MYNCIQLTMLKTKMKSQLFHVTNLQGFLRESYPKNLPYKALRGCTGRTFHTHAGKYTHVLMVDATILSM